MDGQFKRIPVAVANHKGLTPIDKLVYASIADRVGRNGRAWPSMRTISVEVGSSERSVIRSVKKLEMLGLLDVSRSRGRTSNRYTCRKAPNPATEAPLNPDQPCQPVTDRESSMTQCHRKPCHSVTVNPDTVSHEPDLTNQTHKPDSLNTDLFGDAERVVEPKPPAGPTPKQIDALYAAYPRKVAAGPARKAIRGALERLRKRPDIGDPYDWLLERVQKFAGSYAGNRRNFTPHPATWFNGERYDDADGAWDDKGSGRSVALQEAIVVKEFQP